MIQSRYPRRIIIFVAFATIAVRCHELGYFRSHGETMVANREKSQENPSVFMDRPLIDQARNQQASNLGIKKVRRSRALAGNTCGVGGIAFDYTTKFFCQYDKACYETFYDCCPDYEKECGKQNKTTGGSSVAFKCVKMGRIGDKGCQVLGADGVWMIQECPTAWPSDETKRKCQNPPEKFSYPVEDYLPVVGQNQFTYRNKHCAVCNGVHNYSTWGVKVWTIVTPPAKYDLDEKMRFIVKNGGLVDYVAPADQQPRRYCAGDNYKDGCDNVSHNTYDDCLNGPVEVVVDLNYDEYYYKNRACAVCNGDTDANYWEISVSCGKTPEGFSILYNIRKVGLSPTRTIIRMACPPATVYDKDLEFCRKGYVTLAKDNLSNKFLVALWSRDSSIQYSNTSALRRPFTSSLVQHFSLMPTQISAIRFHRQDYRSEYIVASFRLTLTPYQDLVRACDEKNVNQMEISTKSKKFLQLLSFAGNFTLQSETYRFPVIKLASKQLACFEGRILQPDEYELDKKTGQVFENKTGKDFSLKDYSILDGGGGNITLCRKLVLSGCNDGAFVPLHKNEFVILSNLSLYHNATNRTFEFGEYQIIEGLDTFRSDKKQGRIANFPRNTTFAVCLPYRRRYNHTDTRQEPPTSQTLRILTLIGFSMSIIWLLLLLVTYGLFKELRTLPGMNLMNLSISLLVSHLVWLIGTAYFQMTTLCTVLAILEHYLFLVSFVAMTVISYHSSRVFSQPFVAPKPNEGQRTFLKYSAVVWACPAIFIAICVTLDNTGSFSIDYGTNCWLGTKNAILYLFLLPCALLLLYNVITFIRTAVSLSQHHSQSQVLQIKNRENLLICTKLATLVGFPWIFAFLGVFFVDVVAFEYLFVTFVSLQGFYIGVAFLCTERTLKLYRNRWKPNRNANVGAAATERRRIELPTFRISLKTVVGDPIGTQVAASLDNLNPGQAAKYGDGACVNRIDIEDTDCGPAPRHHTDSKMAAHAGDS